VLLDLIMTLEENGCVEYGASKYAEFLKNDLRSVGAHRSTALSAVSTKIVGSKFVFSYSILNLLIKQQKSFIKVLL
jgi:hypothetical protein